MSDVGDPVFEGKNPFRLLDSKLTRIPIFFFKIDQTFWLNE